MRAGDWRPGSDCGSWVSSLVPIAAQGQVLIANVLVNLRRLPVETARALYRGLCPSRAAPFRPPEPSRLTSLLCGVGLSTVNRLRDKFDRAEWGPDDPVVPANLLKRQETRQQAEQARGERVWQVLVREGLHNAFYGHGDVDYLRSVSRLGRHGLDVGDRFHSRMFPPMLEQLAMRAVERVTDHDLRRPLPGTGIRTDVALMFDGVSIGATSFATAETLQLVGLGFINALTGGVCERLVGAPSAGSKHDGDSTTELVLATLAGDPFLITIPELRRILTCVGGDGVLGASVALGPLVVWRRRARGECCPRASRGLAAARSGRVLP